MARHRYPELEFTQGALEHLPYEDASFDVVTCCDTLEHVEDERLSLNELARSPTGRRAHHHHAPPRAVSRLDHSNYLPASRRLLARRLPGLFATVQQARNKAGAAALGI